MANDFSTWYNTVPQFTRYWLTATVAISILGKLGVFPAVYLYLDFALVVKKLQVSSKFSFISDA